MQLELSSSLETDSEDPSIKAYDPSMEMSKRSYQNEKWRRMLTISATNVYYQIWKAISILFSFVSSFKYGYVATFLDRMSEEEREYFKEEDQLYISIFVVSMVIHMLLDEHSYAEG